MLLMRNTGLFWGGGVSISAAPCSYATSAGYHYDYDYYYLQAGEGTQE